MGGMRVLEWAVGLPGARRARGRRRRGRGRRPPSRSRCAACRSARSKPTRSGAAATTTTPSPATVRTSGLSIARGIGQIRYRSELELDARFGRDHQGDERPLEGGRYAVESYLEYHGEKLARRFDANTYLVLQRGDEPPRRRAAAAAGSPPALARITADVTIAGITSDRLYPLRLQHELAELIPTAGGVTVIDSIVGHDGFLVETEAVGKLITRALE